MRPGFALLSAIMLLLTAVGGAAGARPSTFTEQAQHVACSDIASGTRTASFYVRVSDQYGPEAYLDVWAGEPYNSDLVYQRNPDEDLVISFAPTVSITIPLLPGGVAVIAGETTPVGSIDVSDRYRDGNVQVRISTTGTQSTFSGTLQLPDDGPVPLDPASCGSSDTITTQSATQPNARVRAWSSTGGVCDLENEDGDSATVFLSPFEGAMLAIDGWATDSGGSEVGFFGAGEIVGGAASFPIEEYDTATGEPNGIQESSADVSLTETGDDFSYVIRASNYTGRVTGSLTDVDGSLATSIGVFDLDPCVISVQRTKEITTPSNGPKPGGKRPANDLPSGAVTLKPGARTTVATKGAQQASEAAFPCMVFTDEEGTEFTAPVERTVWYRITGTGGEITVDTAGSSFDTVAAAYEGAPDASSTVACVDDVPVVPFGRTLQAAVTFPTIAGVSYFVQVGGYLENDGINVPYGTLKVAVR